VACPEASPWPAGILAAVRDLHAAALPLEPEWPQDLREAFAALADLGAIAARTAQ
jgi:hypothetical protein